MGYQIKNKELYLDGKKVQLEVGNKEQIAFIKEYEDELEQFTNSGIPLYIEVETITTISTSFKCICSKEYISIDIESESSFSDENDLIGEEAICRSCNSVYVIDEDENGDIVAKIKINKNETI